MNTRQLGTNGPQLTEIGLGAWAIGGQGAFGWGASDDKESIATVHRSLDLGVNWIDTAPVYGHGHSEEVIGKALEGRRDKVFLATKCGMLWDERKNVRIHLGPESIRREMEASLKRLKTDHVDLYQFHWPDPSTPVEESWQEMANLKEEGKTRYIGVCNFDVPLLTRCEKIQHVQSLQPIYNMLERKVEKEIFPYCQQHGVGVVVYSPMQSGLLTETFDKKALAKDDWRRTSERFTAENIEHAERIVRQLKPIASRHDKTVAQLAIAWVLMHKAATSAIVGARRVRHAEQNVGGAGWTIPEKEMAAIERILSFHHTLGDTMDNPAAPLDQIAEQYVRLVLAVGHHDPDYVDAYYGPAEWKAAVDKERPALDEIKERAKEAIAATEGSDARSNDEMLTLRRHYLRRQLQALLARVGFLAGMRMTFDEESEALYDAVAPEQTAEHFERLVQSLGEVLPGTGPVPERYDRFKAGFVIPKEKLDRVFSAAIDEGRRRTGEHIALPADESFTVEYVTGKSWSGYNWYKGNSHSLIQMNTDLPIYIDRAVDLACHEGYPGHHVYNSLLEQYLVRERGWMEFTTYALFSPQSLIAEGTANYGIEMALPGDERVVFESETLFPLAGLDGKRAEQYYRAHALFLRLGYAGNEAARRYLNGEITREAAVDWLVRYALMAPDRAQQRTRFFDQYRSYVINYNLGQDLVKKYIESKGGTPESPERRWKVFAELLSSPRLPSGLRVG